MANIPEKENPGFPEVYVLEETDPVVGGIDGIDNLPHKQLAERDRHLLGRIQPLEATAGEHEERLQSVEISGSVSVGRAFPIWLAESDQGADFELFADAAYTWRDYPPTAIVATVAGDESVDVATTNNLVVGDAYVIVDPDGTTEVVEVEAILTATRFRATGTLSKTREATGTLARTSWDIRAGYALAGDGLYFSREIKTLRFDDAGRLILRRADGDGSVRVKARRTNAPATGWQTAPLKRSAATDGGVTDLEFRIPVGGTVELQIETERGPSGEPIEIHHLVCLPEVRAGRADAVRQPTNVTPAEGTTDVMETPTLTGDAYHSLYGVAQQAAEFEVATDAEFANIVYQGSETTAVVQHAVAAGHLATNQVYWWRCRYQDAEGTWSPWSKPTGFATGSVFEYVEPPTISAPADGAVSVSLTPTIQTDAFNAIGATDSHTASQYQIATDSAFTSIAYDSGTVTDLTGHTVPSDSALTRNTQHYIRARHQGMSLGWSDWSPRVGIVTANSPDAPTITNPADGATGITFDSNITTGAFSSPAGDAHVATQWQFSTVADFSTIAFDSDEDTTNLTSFTLSGASLDTLTTYYVRTRHKGSSTGYSAWSPTVVFETQEPEGEVLFTDYGTHSWTVPDGVTEVFATVLGGGGGGGTPGDESNGNGGGGGGYAEDIVPVTPGETISVTVGRGGAGGNVTAWAFQGGSSSFGSFISATGGGPGNNTSSNNVGGSGAGGTVNGTGGAGGTWTGGDGQPGSNGGAGGGASGPSGGHGGAGSGEFGGGGGGTDGGSGGSASGVLAAPGGDGISAPQYSGGDGGDFGGGGGGCWTDAEPNAYGGKGADGIVYLKWGPNKLTLALGSYI